MTLLELENIEAFIQDRGLPLTPGIPRRNIVTRGVRLNELFGERFRVGAATFEGLGLCEPCAVFAKVTHREALKFFVRKGGMRARIIEGGEVRVGDFVGEDAWRFVRADRRAQRAAAFRSAVPGWLSASVATVADLSTRPLDAMT